GARRVGAFRDLETIESMGISEAPNDRIRYARESMLFLFRTAPEVVDSVFNADAAPLFDRPFRTGDAFRADLDETVENAKKVIVGGGGNESIYRQTTVLPDPAPEGAFYPDSLRTAGVSGRVSVQVRVTAEGDPVAVSVVDSVHPVLDALVMRQAATSSFNPAWVVQGRRGGVAVPNYYRTGVTFE
ncbi:MAG: TonB family protein, partial [Bacteroidota bacterium]